MPKPLLRTLTLLTLTFTAFSCEKDNSVELVAIEPPEAIYLDLPPFPKHMAKAAAEDSYEIVKAEYFTDAESDEIGNTVLFNVRGNKRLNFDFAPENSEDGTADISYYIDDTRPSADIPVDQGVQAIQRAMDTWEGVSCSQMGLHRIPSDGRATGYIAAIFGYGGSTQYVADVVHAGWMPGEFFTRLFGSRGRSIIGVTFTVVHRESGVPVVDTNGDKKADVAFREIYYNDRYNWDKSMDAESIALHETGHGLSQEHFGKAFRNNKTGKVHYSPRAVMNPIYSGVQAEIAGTDNAGHCGLWAQWPTR